MMKSQVVSFTFHLTYNRGFYILTVVNLLKWRAQITSKKKKK